MNIWVKYLLDFYLLLNIYTNGVIFIEILKHKKGGKRGKDEKIQWKIKKEKEIILSNIYSKHIQQLMILWR